MDYSGSVAIWLRTFGQKLGALRPAVRIYRRVLAKSYEERFHRSLLDLIRPGDVVRDIGANVGVYTTVIADCVSPSGTVVAFEPSPGSYAALEAAVNGRSNVLIHNVALSCVEGQSTFYVNNDQSGTTDGFTQRSDQSRCVEVVVKRGDAFRHHPPCVVKVDVEGFELEVLQGMPRILADPRLRAIFVEVHFLELANRGLRSAPADIVSLLRAADFTVQWIDPSHIGATRRTPSDAPLLEDP